MTDHPAAWHPDPLGRHEHRYWDGVEWTDHVADAGVASIDVREAPAPPEPAFPGPVFASTTSTEPSEPVSTIPVPEPGRRRRRRRRRRLRRVALASVVLVLVVVGGLLLHHGSGSGHKAAAPPTPPISLGEPNGGTSPASTTTTHPPTPQEIHSVLTKQYEQSFGLDPAQAQCVADHTPQLAKPGADLGDAAATTLLGAAFKACHIDIDAGSTSTSTP